MTTWIAFLVVSVIACRGGQSPISDSGNPDVADPDAPDPGSVFATPITLSTGANAFDAASADFNNDGVADLAVVHNHSTNTVGVLINTSSSVGGAPSFAPQVDLATPDEPTELAIADFNADGRPDVAVVGTSASVFLNTTATAATTPSFSGPFAIDVPPLVYITTVTTADINGDGRGDLLVGTGASELLVFLNTTATGATAPSFGAPTSIPAEGTPRGLVAGDLNADGRPDVIVAADNMHVVLVFLNLTTTNATTPLFAARGTFSTGQFPAEVALGDLDSDGRDDLAVANLNGTLSILLNETATNATTPLMTATADLAIESATDVTFVDLDGSRLDIAATSLSANQIRLFTNTTTGASPTFSSRDFPTDLGPMSIRFADLNRDGKLDAFTANQGVSATDGSVSISIGL